MGVLLVQQNHCKRVGGQLALCGVKDLALEAFRLTKLDLLFKIYDTQDQAVAALVATLPR
jgi:anti-anti-sigma regulatory factor